MSLESQQRGLFIVACRKRDRSPSSEREEWLSLAPTTPSATERRRMFDEEDDRGVTIQERGHNYVSEIQETHKKSRTRPWLAYDNAFLLAHQNPIATPDLHEDSPSHIPFPMSTFDLSADDSLNVGTQWHAQSRLLSLSRESIVEDIANASAAVTAFHIVSRPADDKPVVVQPAPKAEDLQSGHPDNEASSNNPGDSRYHSNSLSGEEKCLGSSASVGLVGFSGIDALRHAGTEHAA